MDQQGAGMAPRDGESAKPIKPYNAAKKAHVDVQDMPNDMFWEIIMAAEAGGATWAKKRDEMKDVTEMELVARSQ